MAEVAAGAPRHESSQATQQPMQPKGQRHASVVVGRRDQQALLRGQRSGAQATWRVLTTARLALAGAGLLCQLSQTPADSVPARPCHVCAICGHSRKQPRPLHAAASWQRQQEAGGAHYCMSYHHCIKAVTHAAKLLRHCLQATTSRDGCCVSQSNPAR